jgi:hypothetical protein
VLVQPVFMVLRAINKLNANQQVELKLEITGDCAYCVGELRVRLPANVKLPWLLGDEFAMRLTKI